MKEKALYSTLMASMIISAIFMLFILKGIDSVRTCATAVGPGKFDSLIQLNHGIDNYAIALQQYQFNIGKIDEQQYWASEYQSEFNTLWKNLNYFAPSTDEFGTTESLLLSFKQDAQQFSINTEHLMTTEHELNAEQVATVLDDLNVLRSQIHEVGREYFHSYLAYRDIWTKKLSNLYKQLLFFSAVLATTTGLLIAFLIRSNRKKNMLIRETADARSALSNTVEELRSGRREQRAKDSFIAAASHDLRQPLHALGLFLDSLKAHVVDNKGKSTLNEAIECSASLGSLFNSLLDLSRLDAGIVKVEREHFKLQYIVAILQHEYQAKTVQLPVDIKIQVQDEVVVNSDPILLLRIVRNLIENALIHSHADTITVKCIKKNNFFQLSVQDNGVGISQAEQQRVFNEYYQINSRSSGAGKGLGLGLSIVKRLADLLDMRITLQSEVGVSTTFTMDICAGDERQIMNTQSRPNAMQNIMRGADGIVAVIDDDEKICTAMASMLQSIGLRTITATSADSLIDNIIESDTIPSIIVADYHLQKGKTGDQAIIQLRRALNMDIPGLLITGDTAPKHVADAAQSGFELLHKPVQPAELSNKIRNILEKRPTKTTKSEAESDVTLVT